MESFIIADIYIPRKELKRIARTVLKAQDIRENSWDGEKYTTSHLLATKMAAAESKKLNKRIIPVICRWNGAMWNDAREWAMNTLLQLGE